MIKEKHSDKSVACVINPTWLLESLHNGQNPRIFILTHVREIETERHIKTEAKTSCWMDTPLFLHHLCMIPGWRLKSQREREREEKLIGFVCMHGKDILTFRM
jgi:hypothetical protein